MVEDAYLAVLNFATYRLWRDLRDHWRTFLESPVAKHLIETPYESFDDADRHLAVSPRDVLCPGQLDASQLGAVQWALEGTELRA